VMPGKGWRARWGSRGRYRPIRKRSSHIVVVLEERL
jgi:ribosomal protein L22